MRGEELLQLRRRGGRRGRASLGQHGLRVRLAFGDVGLVERVDPEHRTRHRRGELPAEELLPEVVAVVQLQVDHRMAGLLQLRRGGLRLRRRPRRPGPSTRTPGRRRTPRAGPAARPPPGRMPLPSLPVLSAISCSAQRPKLAMPGREHEGDLVPPGQRALAQDGAEPGRRVSPAPARRRRRPPPSGARDAAGVSTSTPISAAGTRPKNDSAE